MTEGTFVEVPVKEFLFTSGSSQALCPNHRAKRNCGPARVPWER
jgi:hypothetical protein